MVMSPPDISGRTPPAGRTSARLMSPTPVQMLPFDINGPLPTGTALLEASAGTGKTHTIGSLLTRYIAEGVATLDQILVVTFGRTASQELRERIRAQLVIAERELAGNAAVETASAQDAQPIRGGDAELRVRRSRLIRALADFDAATIATTHQFCQQVLTELGVAGDTDQGVELVEDLDELIVQVVDDLYLRQYGVSRRVEPGELAAAATMPAQVPSSRPPFSRAQALELGRKAVGDPQAFLEPVAVDPNSEPGLRRRFAAGVRAEVDRRKQRLGILGYDDLLSKLADALRPETAAARDRMRGRWQFVLVDEFQDTDPVQWQVLQLAFADHATMVLVGDPKQAIYAFRGGDVFTYLGAARSADSQATLSENFRSDAPLVQALQATLDQAQLGDPDIVARPVVAAIPGTRLLGAPSSSPFRLRVVRRDQLGINKSRLIPVARAREFVAGDLTADVATLLSSAARFGGRPIAPGDIAVLVATHKQAALVQEHLARQAIPVVIAGGGSVYATEAADNWLILLEALEQPHSAPKARAAAMTDFLGLDAAELGDPDPQVDSELTDQLTGMMHRWSGILAHSGVAALFEVINNEYDLGPRLLARTGGERLLTDLRHIGQDLHATMVNTDLALPGLTQWIRLRRIDAERDHSPERIRRLDSDKAAVQVVTLHASKGLQYPVVYLPFAFDRWVAPADILLYHDDAGRRTLDVGGSDVADRQQRQDRESLAAAELAGESLRLLYVGLTRAQSQVITWWAPTTNTPTSALHRLLFGRQAGSGVIPDSQRVPSDDAAATEMDRWAARGGPTREPAVPAKHAKIALESQLASVLSVRDFSRSIDTQWRRTSYSALTATDNYHAPVQMPSESEVTVTDDERLLRIQDATVDFEDAQEAIDVVSPMQNLPRGTAFGTLIHAIFEHVDPRPGDPETLISAQLLVQCTEQLRRFPIDVSAAELVEALLPVYSTPLGPLASGLTLGDIGVSDRLTELTFEMPLTGGERPSGLLTLGDLAPLWDRHIGSTSPMGSYSQRLAGSELSSRSLRGYLNGSLDAVLRLPGPRYLIVDYKTNWLAAETLAAPESVRLTALDYHPTAMARAMAASDYPLQALLYSVALHRFLRWRQPQYCPETHLGGLLYLFVRGMCGPETPAPHGQPCGVFSWQPPAQFVVEVSDLLDRGSA